MFRDHHKLSACLPLFLKNSQWHIQNMSKKLKWRWSDAVAATIQNIQEHHYFLEFQLMYNRWRFCPTAINTIKISLAPSLSSFLIKIVSIDNSSFSCLSIANYNSRWPRPIVVKHRSLWYCLKWLVNRFEQLYPELNFNTSVE